MTYAGPLCGPAATRRRFKVAEGVVKWFSNEKGYGFISRDQGGDVFVHYTGIKGDGFKTLAEGDRVKFEITKGPKGEQAVDVVKA